MNNTTRPQNLARRRLARGVVATPAVIASLTAKNALAGKYHCAVSGKASGNMSHKDTSTDCRNSGHPCSTWKDLCKDDTTPVKNCLGVDYKGKTEGSGWNKKHKRANNNCGEYGFISATCAQVLNGEDYKNYPISDPPLLLAGLCAYLNAKQFPTTYHISMADAAGLYKGALGLAPFKTGTKTWTAYECKEHLQALFY